MPYTPSDLLFFTAAFAGGMSGQGATGRDLTDPEAADYAPAAANAQAWAQEMDIQWAATAYHNSDDVLSTVMCFLCSDAYWSGRTAIPSVLVNNAESAAAIIAMIEAALLWFASQGVTPPPWNSGTGTLPTVTANEVLIGTGAPGYAGSPHLTWNDSTTTLQSTEGITRSFTIAGTDSPDNTTQGGGVTIRGGNPTNGSTHAGGNVLVVGGGTVVGGAPIGGNLFLAGGGGTTQNGNVFITNNLGSTTAIEADFVDGIVEIGLPLIGNAGANDPLRFGVSSPVDVTPGGTIVLTPAEYCLQTITFGGTSPAGPLIVQVPDVEGYTKVLDFTGAVLTATTTLTIRRGATGGSYTITLDSSNFEALVIVSGYANYLKAFALQTA